MERPSGGDDDGDTLAKRRLQLLSVASRALAEAGLDVPQVLETVSRKATTLLADGCTISLVSADGEYIDIVAASDRDAAAGAMLQEIAREAPRLRKGEGLAGAVLESGRPILIRSVDQDHLLRSASSAYREFVARFPFQSLLIVPLRSRARVVGTIALTRRFGEPYDDSDVQLVTDIAELAGHALENARLYQRVDEARQAAENAVRSRDNVLAIVSHDLRNPLAAIVMTAKRLVREATVTTKQQGELILRSAARMERLIRDLLDVAQIDAGALAVDLRPYDVAFLLSSAEDMLLPELAARSQRLEVAPCVGRVCVDRERVMQVLTNLVGNASKFAPPHSTIYVSAAATESEIAFSVRDEGPGIASEAMSSLFDRFVQSARGPSRRLGVGLGLAIAKGIVEAHHGRLIAESTEGEGATFTAVFRRAGESATPSVDEVASFLVVERETAEGLLARAANDVGWDDGPAAGVSLMPVGDTKFLVRIAPHATYPHHAHASSEHLLILAGGLRDGDGAELWVGDRVTNARGTAHSSTALGGGCLLAARIDPE